MNSIKSKVMTQYPTILIEKLIFTDPYSWSLGSIIYQIDEHFHKNMSIVGLFIICLSINNDRLIYLIYMTTGIYQTPEPKYWLNLEIQIATFENLLHEK